MNFNVDQQRAIDCTDTDCMIVAIPGSGKTATGIGKTAHILEQSDDNKMCYVVYNASAADEVRERVEKVIEGKLDRLTTGTYHALGYRQLRDAGLKLNILSGQNESHLKHLAWAKSGYPCPEEEIFDCIDKFKTDLLAYTNPDLFYSSNESDPTFAIYTKYQSLLDTHSSVDFHDILIHAIDGMNSGKVKPISCTHLIADEFQDSDAIQLGWLHAHKKFCGAVITVVGDDDQTIYSWRSALGYQGFLTFKENYNATQIVLDTNYRSNSEILEAAAKVIEINKDRIPKVLKSFKGPGGSVSIFKKNEIEAEYLEIIKWYWSSTDFNKAVLARNNRTLSDLGDILKSESIPFVRKNGDTFWGQSSIQVLMDLISSVFKVERMVVERMAIHLNIQVVEIEILMDQSNCLKKYVNIKPVNVDTLSFKKWNILVDLLKQNKQYIHAKQDSNINKGIENIKDFLLNNLDWDKLKKKKLYKDTMIHGANALKKMKGTWLARYRKVSFSENEKKENLTLMTFHGSKGLEFEKVWILGASESTLPPKKSRESIADWEEERRLFYVAMTRAESSLCISYTKEPCRFLVESMLIEPEDMEADENEHE